MKCSLFHTCFLQEVPQPPTCCFSRPLAAAGVGVGWGPGGVPGSPGVRLLGGAPGSGTLPAAVLTAWTRQLTFSLSSAL